MSTSSNGDLSGGKTQPVVSLEYKNIGAFPVAGDLSAGSYSESPLVSLTEQELQQKLQQAHSQGATQAIEQLRKQFEETLARQKAAILEAVKAFQEERTSYYTRVERELVDLALGIAAKILHRESQIDRTLLAALVKVTIENLQHRTNIALRVKPEEGDHWRNYLAQHLPETKVEVLEDSAIAENNCILETELGTAEIGLDSQLKEIERGFFDLLAQRPDRQ
jgi:flagellar assembly protein FliH